MTGIGLILILVGLTIATYLVLLTKNSNQAGQTIDAIITWVNISNINSSNYDVKIEKERLRPIVDICWLHDHYEKISYIDRVFVVVSDTEIVPDCIKNVIRHKELGIPKTLNSMCIESKLHKIPTLSEVFLYSNDDEVVLNDKLDFYYRNGKYTLYDGPWSTIYPKKWFSKFSVIETAHIPQVFYKSVWEEIHDTHLVEVKKMCDKIVRDENSMNINLHLYKLWVMNYHPDLHAFHPYYETLYCVHWTGDTLMDCSCDVLLIGDNSKDHVDYDSIVMSHCEKTKAVFNVTSLNSQNFDAQN